MVERHNPATHDPLGPSRQPIRIGRPVSAWKRHWWTFGNYWLALLGFLSVSALSGLAYWSVSKSADFYVQPPSGLPKPAAVASPPPTRHVDRTVDGPVQLELDVARLELGDRVIVTRDLAKIFDDGVRAQGLAITGTSDRKLIVYYKETPGPRLEVMLRNTDGSSERIDSLLSVQIRAELYLQRPQRDNLLLGSAMSGPREKQVTITPAEKVAGLNRQRQRVYQQTYKAVLDQLRALPLPLPRS